MTTDTRNEFDNAATGYTDALTDWRATITMLREAQAALRAAEFDLETREAELLLNLEVPERSNAEQREALLRAACVVDETYLWDHVAAEEARSDAASSTDAAQAARDRLSLEKRRMDFAIGWLAFLTQPEGGNQ